MIDFSTLNGLTIPEGNVTKITDASGNVLWSAAKPVTLTITRTCQGDDVHHTWFVINGQTYNGGDLTGGSSVESLPTYVTVNVGTKIMCCTEGTVSTDEHKVNGVVVEMTPSADNTYKYYEYTVTTEAELRITEMHFSSTMYTGGFWITET